MRDRSTGWSSNPWTSNRTQNKSVLPFLLLSVAGAWFGFANPVLRLPWMILLFPLGLILLTLRAQTPAMAFKLGWATGAVAYGLSLYWVVIPVHTYGNIPLPLALPLPALLGMYLGLYTGLFCWLLSRAGPFLPWPLAGLFAGSTWALLEMARGTLFTGFPWLVLPSALSPWPWTIQSVSLIGAYGLAGVMVLGVSWLAFGRFRPIPILLSAILALLVSAFGLTRSVDVPASEGTLSVSIVQGNIDQAVKWSPEYQRDSVHKYLELTRTSIEAHGPDLVVWPETALPFYFQEEGELSDLVRDFFRDNETLLVTGAPGYTQAGDELAYHNRAFLVGTEGRIEATYDKEHLVPFGEYVPLRRLLPFLGKLVEGAGDFSPGVSTHPMSASDVALGTLICYEAIFPELSQHRVEQGANILVNMSNDAWFGRSSAPRQHLDLAVLRAVEQNRCMIRATNTGISALVDHRGEVMQPTPLFEDATIHFRTVPLIAQTTFFHQRHDLVRMGIILLPVLILIIALALSSSGRTPSAR
jgi:apolipoprotein N-acyltransferase